MSRPLCSQALRFPCIFLRRRDAGGRRQRRGCGDSDGAVPGPAQPGGQRRRRRALHADPVRKRFCCLLHLQACLRPLWLCFCKLPGAWRSSLPAGCPTAPQKRLTPATWRLRRPTKPCMWAAPAPPLPAAWPWRYRWSCRACGWRTSGMGSCPGSSCCSRPLRWLTAASLRTHT